MKIIRKAKRVRIHTRIRRKLSGTSERPRLAVFFSHRNVTAQVIDDVAGKTIVAASTMKKGSNSVANIASATNIGKAIAEKAKAANITAVVFDRGGHQYHGKVKALADAAREAGLQF
jgi:large subunit ribosomal protein L18